MNDTNLRLDPPAWATKIVDLILSFFHDRSFLRIHGRSQNPCRISHKQSCRIYINCEKWRKRLQPHLKVTLCKCRQLLDFNLQWNKRIYTSYISNSRKGALPRFGITVPVDAFIFEVGPTLTKIPPPKKQIFPPKEKPILKSRKNCGPSNLPTFSFPSLQPANDLSKNSWSEILTSSHDAPPESSGCF